MDIESQRIVNDRINRVNLSCRYDIEKNLLVIEERKIAGVYGWSWLALFLITHFHRIFPFVISPSSLPLRYQRVRWNFDLIAVIDQRIWFKTKISMLSIIIGASVEWRVRSFRLCWHTIYTHASNQMNGAANVYLLRFSSKP